MIERYANIIRFWDIDEIIPVPIHKKRFRQRGFNQSEIIAQEIGRIMNIPVSKNKIIRIKNTKPQKALDDMERIKNIRNAFCAVRGYKPQKNILIIDDIYTTGATIRHIAQILKELGAVRVFFLTISIGQGI